MLDFDFDSKLETTQEMRVFRCWLDLLLFSLNCFFTSDMYFPQINVSQVDLNWKDPYEYVYDGFVLRTVLAVLICVVTAIGTILYLGLISFERFGGDPQKRGILNQVGHQNWIWYWQFILYLNSWSLKPSHWPWSCIGCQFHFCSGDWS